MSDHAGDFEIEGEITFGEEGRFRVPEPYKTQATVHTSQRTIVRHKNARTVYETAHPNLAREDGAYLALKRHGDDAWAYYRLVPE